MTGETGKAAQPSSEKRRMIQAVPKPLPKSKSTVDENNHTILCSNDCRRYIPLPAVIMCRHIVLKHNQSRNAISHRTGLNVTIPLEAAERIVELVRQKLVPVSGGMLDKHFSKVCSASRNYNLFHRTSQIHCLFLVLLSLDSVTAHH